MMKVILILAMNLIASSGVYAQQNNDNWLRFENEFSFPAEILAHDAHLDYWAMPIIEDKEGFKRARDMIELMGSVTHMENPFILKIRLAGLNYDYSDPLTLGTDEVSIGGTKAIKDAGRQRMAIVKCLGYYSEVIIPLCFVNFEKGRSIQRTLLEGGFTTISKNIHEIDGLEYIQLKEAEKKARDKEIGVWVPFYYLKKAMTKGQ